MRLTILGSGSPEPSASRASSGYLVEVGEDRLLFDCGGGVFDRLLQAGLRPSDVDYVFFSHLHSDHMMDYARLVHAAWDESGVSPKVIGPKPIASMTRGLFGPDGVFAADLRARTELAPSQRLWLSRGGSLPRPLPTPEITEIAAGWAMDGGGWRIMTCEVPHAQPILECMAFRVETSGGSFVYSGDAGLCEGFERFSRNADVLLHWCYRLDGERAHPGMESLTPTPSEIARMARRAGVKRLLLTHFRVHMDVPARRAGAVAALRETFGETSEVVEDLKVYDIGDRGVARRPSVRKASQGT